MKYIFLFLLMILLAGFTPGQTKAPEPPEKVFYYATREYGKPPTEVWMIVASGCWNVTKVVMVERGRTTTSEQPCLFRPRYTRPTAKN